MCKVVFCLLNYLFCFFFLTFSLPSALLDLKIPNGTWTERSAILDFSFVALILCEGYDQRLDINLFNVKVEFWANISVQKIKFVIETSRIMIRNHLHSQRIKTIKTITRSSMDFFLIYKCLQLARKKILLPTPPPPLPPATPFHSLLFLRNNFRVF